jgi:hypothetical protein
MMVMLILISDDYYGFNDDDKYDIDDDDDYDTELLRY